MYTCKQEVAVLSYRFYYTDDGGLFTIYSGHLTDEQAITCLREKVRHPDFGSALYSVVDFTDVTQFELTTECMRQIATINVEASTSNSNLLCVGINPTQLSHGITRMWQGYTPDEDTGWTTISVVDFDEARDCIKTLLNITIPDLD